MTVTKTPISAEPTLPITDIVIKTFSGDAEYHRYCMESIQKFCTGFRQVVVLDDGDTKPPKPYLFQQKAKMEADLHTDADFILVTDSDTLMNQPVTPESFIVDGKPIWIHTPWTPEMLAHPGTATWKRVMTEFFGQEPLSEKMRRQPFMFPRHVLHTLREYCVAKHGVDLSTYIMRGDAFSEWNILGFHCWLHHRDDFHWVNSETDPLPPLLTRQFWSHSPLAENLEEINRILA